MFKTNSTIIPADENEAAYRYLVHANNTSERMWTLYFKYIAASMAGELATALLSIIYLCVTDGNFDVKYLYRPAKYV